MSINRTLHLLRFGTYRGQVIFKQPKTDGSRRPIALSPSNTIVLREHREAQDKLRISLDLPPSKEDDLIFCQPDGKPYQPDSISHFWMKLARRTGLRGIRFHDARHTMATIMLEKGIHPKIVQERLGHRNISTTLDTYSHVVPGLQQAAAVRLDEILIGQAKNTDSHNTTLAKC